MNRIEELVDGFLYRLDNLDRKLSPRQQEIFKTAGLMVVGACLGVSSIFWSAQTSSENSQAANLKYPEYNPSTIDASKSLVANFPTRLHEVIEAGQAENISQFIDFPALDNSYQAIEVARKRQRDFMDSDFLNVLRFLGLAGSGVMLFFNGLKEAAINWRLIILGREAHPKAA